jgi:cation diffusion facilitator CzcD-associated flavoprotein CzcO
MPDHGCHCRQSRIDILTRVERAEDNMSGTVRIAVIGAGPAGLAQAKQAIDTFNSERYAAKTIQPRKLELIVFESRDQVGGVWYVSSLRQLMGQGT